jgi:hypothetical protein
MLVSVELGADFSRGCRRKRIGHLVFATHPPYRTAICEWLYVSTVSLGLSPQRIFIHCSNILCLAISRRVENRPLSAHIGVDYEYLRSWFADHGPQLRTLEDGPDASPMAEFVSYIRRGVAKLERADIAKRSRRGQLQKAREGKILAGRRPKYGFKLNATRDGYEADEEEMRVVRCIFEMVGVESRTLHAVKRALEREGKQSPDGKPCWDTPVIRRHILDDVYRPHTYEETAKLVSVEVAAKLDPDERYGVSWYNRHRITRKQIAEDGPEGWHYRHVTKTTEKDRSEWIAVPVPDSGIPREWVDAARESVRNNKKPSSAGRRYWELSGGVFRCGGCGSRITTETAWGSRSQAAKKYFYYKCPKYWRGGLEVCPNTTTYRAEKVESLVWGSSPACWSSPRGCARGSRR